MKRSAAFAASAFVVVSLLGCGKHDPTPNVQALQFPVVVLFGNSSILVCRESSELTTMHTNYLTLNDQPPRLIDSKLNIFAMEHLRSVHGGLWLMTNPSGATEVTFELKRQSAGRTEAQRLFAEQLHKQTWRDDQAKQLEALGQTQTLREMTQILQPNDG